MSALQIVRLHPLGAEGTLTTSDLKPNFVRPLQIIAIKNKHLDDSYIVDMLHQKGLNETQITAIRSAMRKYIDSFLEGKSVELDEGAYRVLTNMLIHLIEESSKE